MVAKRKICVVTSNRAGFSRLITTLEELKKHKNVEVKIVAMASHLLPKYGQTVDYIEKEGFKVNARLNTIVAGNNPVAMANSVGLAILELTPIFSQFNPDIVLLIGDRFDAIPIALAASIMNIRVAHIQGGERTGTIDESLRHAITKLSHIHFPSTEESQDRIINLGEDSNHVHNVGCPVMDYFVKTKICKREDLVKYVKHLHDDNKKFDYRKPYAILMQHPVTTEYKQAYSQMMETLKAIYESKLQTILFYPNVDAGSEDMINAINEFTRDHPDINDIIVKKFKHVAHKEFVHLLANADLMIGNSSAGIRETSFFSVPTINIGTRQNHRERDYNVLDVCPDKMVIKEAIKMCLNTVRAPKSKKYGNGTAGKQIAKILAKGKLPPIQKLNTY